MSSVTDVLNRHITRPAVRVPEVGARRVASFVPTVRAVNETKRQITFVASDETVDRYGDIIRASGWETKEYLKNPVVLWAHRSQEPPVGRTVALSVEGNALIQTVEFASKETYPFAAQIFELYRGGFLKSVSVGFKPTVPPKPIRDTETDQITGFEFVGQELLELSCVPVPANPNACMRAVGEGIIVQADVGKFFRSVVDEDRYSIELCLTQIAVERLRLTLLEVQCRNLLACIGPKPLATDDNAIKDMAALESALRGEAN